jgi:peptide/nickel transport system substrate-binding protein
LILAIFTAFGAKGAEATGDTLTVIIRDDIGTLDPQNNLGFSHFQAMRQIFETLVIRDNDKKLVPWLAESWNYENDETLVLKIRKGVKFHDGTELKASDVLFSLKRMRDDNTAASMQVVHIDFDKSAIVDDYTVKLVTNGVFATQLIAFENPVAGIISEKAYKETNGNFSEKLIGTGPYKFVSYQAGDNLVLKAHEDYWRPNEPKIPNLLLRIVNDPSSRAIEAESGGADIVYDIDATDVDRIRANPKINLLTAAGSNTSYVTFNLAQKPLDDIRVREAIWYAIDVAAGVQVAYGNYGSVAYAVVSPGIEGRHPDLTSKMLKRDVAKAKALLAEAGYPNGLTLNVCTENSNKQRLDFCEVIQSQLAEVGITLTIDSMEANSWMNRIYNGKGELAIYGISANTGEAGVVLARIMKGNTSEWQIFNYNDPEYYATVEKAQKTIDVDQRNQLLYKGQEMLIDARVLVPVWHKEINAALQQNVKGFNLMTTFEQHYLQFVYFE